MEVCTPSPAGLFTYIILIGTVVVVEAIVLLIRSLMSKNRIWSLLAFIGLLCVLLAWMSGERYVSTQSNSALTYMGNLFFVAVVMYGFGWYWARKQSKKKNQSQGNNEATNKGANSQ